MNNEFCYLNPGQCPLNRMTNEHYKKSSEWSRPKGGNYLTFIQSKLLTILINI